MTKKQKLNKWTLREYGIFFSNEDYLNIQEQIKKQDESKDDIIILKVDYNIIKGTANITDKVCTYRQK